MSSEAVLWTYALAPDVRIDLAHGGAFLRTATSRTWVDADELEVLRLLAGPGTSEVQIHERLRLSAADGDPEARSAALLFRLDHLGLLARGLRSRGRLLVSCIPMHPPSDVLPACPPEGPLRLSARAFARAEANVVSLEIPGSWARMTIHDRDLLALLHDLAVGQPAAAIAAAADGYPEDAILAVLATMGWCGLFECGPADGWSGHDLLFHARTRRGYARAWLGRILPEEKTTPQPESGALAAGADRLRLELPDLPRLIAEDPPYALVSERRRSTRQQGSAPLTSSQLSEFLFRTLHDRGGRRPYPSGGSCYPLQAYLAVHRCQGIAPGLYAYDPVGHELTTVSGPGAGFDELLADAAGTADIAQTPQILLVLAAIYGRTQRVYGDLSYSLILKEAGAVFQTAMTAAAAMGIGVCPLGCGNSLLFADLAGANPLDETSVGEMMIGSLLQSPALPD